jgi:hypothetical protein
VLGVSSARAPTAMVNCTLVKSMAAARAVVAGRLQILRARGVAARITKSQSLR